MNQAASDARPPITYEGGDPYALFKDWFAEAEKTEVNDPNAMALATVGADGMPSVRVVLMKDYDPDFQHGGFTFYTNSLSRKGSQLQGHAQAALCFHWKGARRQVRIEGSVAQVGAAEADAYFASRPRGSQIGAWASLQSQSLPARATLEERVAQVEKQYEGQSVPRPPHWTGYRVAPRLIEFWQDMPFRLHDRVIFTRTATGWAYERWYP